MTTEINIDSISNRLPTAHSLVSGKLPPPSAPPRPRATFIANHGKTQSSPAARFNYTEKALKVAGGGSDGNAAFMGMSRACGGR